MKDLDFFKEHLLNEAARHKRQAHRLSISSSRAEDYWAIVGESKAAELCVRLAADLKLLDDDAGEFCKRHLMKGEA